MKRFPRTLTAAAMAGALAVGGATVAQAQIPAPATLTVDGVEYHKQADGTYKATNGNDGLPASPDLTAEQAQAEWEKQQAAQDNNNNGPTGDNTAPGSDNNKPGGTGSADGSLGSSNPGENAAPESEGIPAPADKQDKDGNTWYQHMQDPNLYVKDRNQVNEPITEEMRKAYTDAFPAEEQTPGSEDKKGLAWLALPAALIIGGVAWYLSQDGKTYVKDEARTKETPTHEEKAASDKMLQDHKDEVIAQGGKLAGQNATGGNNTQGATDESQPTSDRGMLAQTGSNTAARGLAALALTAMVAAGAFAARRKIFA
ncbi:hypothetical protein [uncultured Corynebacterium sp.]|uniref:hypothetical protein n=1 Tax=uncultured Corynebacterium sp. TaxID=159447 RepID=UPI0025D31848|nr:hypothetical protein [uncultured Corynebacterium sp.]